MWSWNIFLGFLALVAPVAAKHYIPFIGRTLKNPGIMICQTIVNVFLFQFKFEALQFDNDHSKKKHDQQKKVQNRK